MSFKSDPSRSLAAVAPNDGADLAKVARSLYVGGAGHLRVTAAGDAAAQTLSNVPAGTFVPIEVKRVWVTGTTATLIIALY